MIENRKMPEEFKKVAETHGREMVELVLDAGLCSEAIKKLVEIGRVTGRGEVLAAVLVLARAFNSVSTAYCKEKGWTEEMMALCDRDLQLAFAGKLIVPEDGRIVLDS